ncbi:hypothetical protein AAIH70_16570 [Neorhizobium sp. BT27B]|uniref:hypothetical protein n=1 Tax=Neorhizobium sp. BT27B TaxID=3142625 RepID=UPI003D2DBBAA
MIDEDATISMVLKDKTLIKREHYLHAVLINCWDLFRLERWPRKKISVRIGRMGDGKAPNYRIELNTDAAPTPEQFAEHMAGHARHEGVETAIEFNGLSHRRRGYGFDKETWSTAVESLEELEALEEQFKLSSRSR